MASEDYRSLKVTGPVFGEFNRLKIRLADSNNNRVPKVSDIVAAMIVLSIRHYDELTAALVIDTDDAE